MNFVAGIKEDSEAAYKAATEVAKNMESWNPIRLGLALNFSVFYYEIMKDPKKAIEMANKVNLIVFAMFWVCTRGMHYIGVCTIIVPWELA